MDASKVCFDQLQSPSPESFLPFEPNLEEIEVPLVSPPIYNCSEDGQAWESIKLINCCTD